MERLKRGFLFWLLLVVSLVVTASAQTTQKKVAYQAKITVRNSAGNLQGVGSGLIRVLPTGVEFAVQTHAYPGQTVTKVALTPLDSAWEVVLCANGTAAGDCAYDPADGNLDIEGQIVALMLSAAGINGATFNSVLSSGNLTVELNDGAAGAGTFVRIGT